MYKSQSGPNPVTHTNPFSYNISISYWDICILHNLRKCYPNFEETLRSKATKLYFTTQRFLEVRIAFP